MATNINITRSETEEERELEILRKGLRLGRTKEDIEDYFEKCILEQPGNEYLLARLSIYFYEAQKQSQMDLYVSLHSLKDDPGMFDKFTTQATKSKNSNRRGISAKYTEEIKFGIPQGTEELYVRLRNKKKLFLDDLITSKKIKLENLFRYGYDEIMWEFFDKDGRRGVATLELQKISADMPEGSTTMQNEYGYASYIGSKSGNAFNCSKQ